MVKPSTKTKPKKILFAASEAVPFAKSGGLGDVTTALAKALRKMGYDARIVIPRYWSIGKEAYNLKKILSPMGVQMGNCIIWCEVYEGKVDGVPVYFIEHENYFGRAGIYDNGIRAYDDNGSRFGFFSRAALQLCRDIKFQPDVVHCHDWPTALVASYLKIWEGNDPFFKNTASVLTIHNIAYQGVFPGAIYGFLGLGDQNFNEPKFEAHGQVNFLKGSLFFADAISTVSPSHAAELLTPAGAFGLAPYIERRRDDFVGILNGVDYDHWDPKTDPLLPANYSVSNIAGKAACKKQLQKEFWLEENPNIPIIGIISRFHEQKGFTLLMPVIQSIVQNMIVQFAILGSGEKWLEDFYGGLPARYPKKIGAWIGYNNPKAHLIEAGADFFLMPSLYEPCGLNQIYSLKYGTLPIVRDTGGLRDTVEQYNEQTGEGTGFRFHATSPNAVYYTTGWAVSTYYDRPHHMKMMQKHAMKTNFCWMDAAREYEKLYERAIGRRKGWH